MGENNWYANTDKALQYIRQIASEKESITIFIYGWSRGAVSGFAFLNKLANDTFCRAKIRLCYIFAIDPVPGGPSDRLQNPNQFNFYSLPPKESLTCEKIVYYSDSGNVPEIDTRLFNTPCFSGLYIEDERLSYYAFRANHEEIAGNNLGIALQSSFEERLNNPAFITALLVYYSIIKKSINRGVKFARPLEANIQAGAQALLQYYHEIFLNHPDSPRKFISRNARLNGENLNKMQHSGRIRKPSIGGLFDEKTDLQKAFEARTQLINEKNELQRLLETATQQSTVRRNHLAQVGEVKSFVRNEITKYKKSLWIRDSHSKRVEILLDTVNMASSVNAIRDILLAHQTSLKDRRSDKFSKMVNRLLDNSVFC